jgi:photosystem II CP47 chlorophyll apoprotein
VHCVHTALVAGWAAASAVFEVLTADPSDPVLSPLWRQGAFVLPFSRRLGLCGGPAAPAAPARGLSLGDSALAHAAAGGALVLAAGWHWAYWDLLLFSAQGARAPLAALQLPRVFGVHLGLAGLLCAAFGASHLTLVGLWAGDGFGAHGAPRPLRPALAPAPRSAAAALPLGALAGHHAAAGGLLAAAGLWHAASPSGPALYAALAFGSVEAVLSSSISALFASGAASAALAWYGGPPAPAGLLGPTRFAWDCSFYCQELLLRSSLASWSGLADSVLVLDYAGANPAKGGLLRAGPMVKGDGCVQAWAGHAALRAGLGRRAGGEGGAAPPPGAPVGARRMPAFFEAFPVLLLDRAGLVRGIIPFRRAESRWSLSAGSTRARAGGGALDGAVLAAPPLVKALARKAQLGEVFVFRRGRGAPAADGLFRAGARGWFAYSHSLLALLFVFGHLWHAARGLFKDAWLGAGGPRAEYGAAERLRG